MIPIDTYNGVQISEGRVKSGLTGKEVYDYLSSFDGNGFFPTASSKTIHFVKGTDPFLIEKMKDAVRIMNYAASLSFQAKGKRRIGR